MSTQIRILTTQGTITVRLYDETPLHRDNFIKLVKEGTLNNTLFHRVIKDFMIQGGDPDSIGAPAGKMLGTGGPGYTIPAEIKVPELFHKRGALSAARLGDDMNPKRESSGSQFYIVWGKVYKEQELKQLEKQMAMQQQQDVFNAITAEHRETIMNLRRNRDRDGLLALQEELIALSKQRCKELGTPEFTPEQREAYTTLLAFEKDRGEEGRYQELKDALALDFLLNEQGRLPPSIDYRPITLSHKERQSFRNAHPEAFLPATECYDIPTYGRIFVDRKNKRKY